MDCLFLLTHSFQLYLASLTNKLAQYFFSQFLSLALLVHFFSTKLLLHLLHSGGHF